MEKVEAAMDDFKDTFPLILEHVGLGEGLEHVLDPAAGHVWGGEAMEEVGGGNDLQKW